MMEIKFKVCGKLTYKEGEAWGSDYFPLPWGKYEIEGAIEGSVYSSAGGAWYWRLPGYAIMGYGQYCPWVKFNFSGTIWVTTERDFPATCFKYGWRQNDRKWVYLCGKISPCEEYIAEKSMKKLYDFYAKQESLLRDSWTEEIEQGHLTGKYDPELSRLIQKDPKFKKIEDTYFSRRKIFNHQFFGKNIQILYLGDATWSVYAPESGCIVSPDHLDEPIQFGEGISIFHHPFPVGDVD